MKISKVKILKLFKVLFVVPFLVAVFMALMYLLGGWETIFQNHGPNFYFLPKLENVLVGACVCVVGIGIAWVLIYLITDTMKNISNSCVKHTIVASLIFAMTVGVRIILIYTFSEDLVPFSDFEHAWNWAHGIRSREEYYVLFPAYLNYASYIQIIIKIFGDSFVNVLYMNAVCCGVTAILIYFLALQIRNDIKFALVATVLFVLSPSNIFYNVVGTPEFLAVMFITFGIFLLVKSFDFKFKRKFPFYMLAGVSLGIGSSFKSFGAVVIIAYIIIAIGKIILNIKNQEMSCAWKKMVICLASVCCVVFWFGITGIGLEKYTENNFKIHFEEGATQHFLTVGLNRQGEGQIHVGNLSRKYYEKFVETRGNADEATQYAYNLVIEDWKNNLKDIPTFLVKKLIWTWQDDMMPICYFNSSIGLQPDTKVENTIYKLSYEYIPTIVQLYYFMIVFWGGIGACVVLIGKINTPKIDFCYLIVLGYFGMMLLIEAQSRYKILIFPILCILAAIGMHAVKELVVTTKKLKKREKKYGEALYNNTCL